MNAFALILQVVLVMNTLRPSVRAYRYPSYDPKNYPKLEPKDFMEREVGAIIHMTLEFLKDMDMKMRDVKRVEKKYVRTEDFGSGRIFAAIEYKFDHMITLYKNTSYINHIMSKTGIDLRSDVVGSLQFMLSDYMEFLSLIDLYRERYDYWRRYTDDWTVRDKVQSFLQRHQQYPYHYDPGDY